ncbi:hypothetical protein AB6A40_000165 [Gnathostoma spinigerum]|uniref:Beta-lactamase-related domain-containing protein n=1 Tax=Gnathostoma spinigerum TaxID=75299 RepID=A0ABD6E3I8_9BILA
MESSLKPCKRQKGSVARKYCCQPSPVDLKRFAIVHCGSSTPMGLLLLNASIVIISIAFIVNYISSKLTTHLPIYIDSDGIDPRFQSVEEAFRQNFLDGWEKGGAAFVVYQNGRKVVDLWGGYADVQAARKWRKDTITVVFSLTKAVAALCIGVLVDRAHLAYDDRISEFWPEFGKNGKANITVQMVLSHMASFHLSFVIYSHQFSPSPRAFTGTLNSSSNLSTHPLLAFILSLIFQL